MPQAAIPAVVAGGFAAFSAGTIFTATVYTAFFATLALGVLSHVFADRGRRAQGVNLGRGGGTVGGARPPAAERIVFGRWRVSGDVAWFDESDTILRMGIALSAGHIQQIDAIWSLEHDERIPVERGRLAYDSFLGDDDPLTRVPAELLTTADPPGPGGTNVLDGTPSFKVLRHWSANPVFRVDSVADGSLINDTSYKQDLISYQAALLEQLASALTLDERLRILAEFEDAGGLFPGFDDPVSDVAEGVLTGLGVDPDQPAFPSSPQSPTLGDLFTDFIGQLADYYGHDQTQVEHIVEHGLSVADSVLNDFLSSPQGRRFLDEHSQSYLAELGQNPENAARLYAESQLQGVLASGALSQSTAAALSLAEAINTHADLVGVGPADVVGPSAADVLAHHDLVESLSRIYSDDDDDDDGNGGGGGGGGADRGGDDPNDPGFR